MSIVSDHDCATELREIKLKATPSRKAVLRFLETSDKPVDISLIFESLQKNIKIDPVTVFRILNLFKEKGLVKQFNFKEGKFRYELSSKVNHHHLICQSCGDIQDISDLSFQSINSRIKSKKGFLIKENSMEFFGLCVNCQK